MDLTESIAPSSDQLDAVDLLSGPRVFTIAGVSKGSAEQPVNFQLAEFPRVWRPGKSMRRVLVACWGPDASTYIGRRVKLYCDPDIMFGKDRVGGTRIAALSHIDRPKSVPLLVSRGKSATFTVEPLAEDAPTAPIVPTAAQIAESTDTAELRAWWKSASPELRTLIEARVADLSAPKDEIDGPLIGGAS